MTDLDELDPILREPARILIVRVLRTKLDWVQSSKIAEATGLTSGNVSAHVKKLEAAGYVVRKDAIVNLRPATIVRLTAHGNEAFLAFEAQLDRLRASLHEPL